MRPLPKYKELEKDWKGTIGPSPKTLSGNKFYLFLKYLAIFKGTEWRQRITQYAIVSSKNYLPSVLSSWEVYLLTLRIWKTILTVCKVFGHFWRSQWSMTLFTKKGHYWYQLKANCNIKWEKYFSFRSISAFQELPLEKDNSIVPFKKKISRRILPRQYGH